MDSAARARELLGRARVVLCRPRNPQNLGAVARALCSAGVRELVLVDPQCDPRDPEAFRLAVHAGALLEAARVVPALPDALEGVGVCAGATARTRPERPPLSPRACASLLARAAAEPARVALVFGDERSGLTADEVERVDHVTSIPSAPEQPSWNLAQSVAVYAHELRTACLAQAEPPPSAVSRTEASPAQLAGLDRALAAALSPLNREPVRRRLFRTLARAQLTAREASLWSAVLAALQKTLRK